MDDPNITMAEYIQLEEEKARRRGQEFNWETATYDTTYDVGLADGKTTQEYMEKGCQVFLAHVKGKEVGRGVIGGYAHHSRFPKVYPEDLLEISPTRQVEFHIDLVPDTAPVACTPYQLAPSGMKELSDQLQELSDKGFIRPSSSPWGALYYSLKRRMDNYKFVSTTQERSRGTSEGYLKTTKEGEINMKFEWGKEEDEAFQLPKQKICSAPILALPKGTKDFVVYNDASYKGLGVILMQKDNVIAYAS
nr:reverse transcriptase domain-containing protein [Tanacetum cinerariifolium]